MPDYRRRWCKGCDKRTEEVGPLSWSGLCSECGPRRLRENVLGLHTMTGEPVLRWRRGMAASVGAVLVDDPPPSER
jgi:hypothetical protein